MKYIKNTVADLKALFEERITADTVAEEFEVWDGSVAAEQAREELVRREFDIVGIHEGSQCIGYARREDLTSGRLVDHVRPLTDLTVVKADSGLRHAVEKVFAERRVIVRPDEGPLGIVTRGDMNKAPVRMWLFSLVTLLEMQMLRVIRSMPQAETFCQSRLPPKRLNEVLRMFETRIRTNSETDLLDCLQFGDKVTLLEHASQDANRVKTMGFSFSATEIKGLREVEKLRNDVAHGNDLLVVHAQRDLPKCARQAEELLLRLEKARQTS